MSSSAHASNLREKFGKNLNDKHKGLTLAETLGTIDDAKIDSQVGQALGTMANKAVGVDYTDNAMYGEMSNQQKTKAKLDAQGGVGGAVGIDVLDSSIKAKTQKDVLDEQLKNSGALKGLDDSAKNIEKAADKLAQTAGAMAGGKTASDISAIDSIGRDKYIEQSKKSGVESAAKMGAQFDNAKAVLSKELGREATDKEVQERLNRENRTTEGFKSLPARVGGAIVDGFEGLTGIDIDGDGEVAAGVAGGLLAYSEIRGIGKGGGVATKGLKGLKKGGNKIMDKLFNNSPENISDKTFGDSQNKTNDSSTTNKDSQPKQDSVKKTEFDSHNKTSDINSNNIVSESSSQDKPSIAQEIEAQQKALNPNNPDIASRHAREMGALQDAHLQRIEASSKPNLSKPNKNLARLQSVANVGKTIGEGIIFG
jgi:hypothetical protein